MSIAVKKHINNMDEYRHAIERMGPIHSISAPHHERVLTPAATLLVEQGIVTKDELEMLVESSFPLAAPPRSFEIGETVRVKYEFVSGHHGLYPRQDRRGGWHHAALSLSGCGGAQHACDDEADL